MKYIEVDFNCNPNSEIICDILAANLAEIGYESFVQNENGLVAYVVASNFSSEETDAVIANFILDTKISYSFKEMENKNWNEIWEKNFFKPIVIDDRCIIRSSFHEVDANCEYDIMIDPKMAFGTGHHQTTRLMIEEMLEMDLTNQSVLDMGCGTAVLAILASKKNATQIDAIDIDEWACDNAHENIKLNNAENIKVMQGDADLLTHQQYDIIIANINRNILLQDIPQYVKVLKENGILMMSGFYVQDIPVLSEKCEQYGLKMIKHSQIDNWAMMVCR